MFNKLKRRMRVDILLIWAGWMQMRNSASFAAGVADGACLGKKRTLEREAQSLYAAKALKKLE